MNVWTAQYKYPGPHRLDITVKGKDPIGQLFAPTWDMVMAHKNSAKTEADNKAYIEKYHQIIINVIKNHPKEWKELLSRPNLVIVCFCPPGHFCHRHLLVHYLKHYGAIYHGEITDFSRWQNKQLVINEFRGEYAWLSNFAPCEFEYQGIVYPTTEHFYQAWKFSADRRAEIAALPTPGATKRAGRKAKLCWNWDTVRVEVMKVAIDCKYDRPDYGTLLLNTKDAILIEGNHWHDNFWGDCHCPKCEHIKGVNMLGKLTMAKRKALQSI